MSASRNCLTTVKVLPKEKGLDTDAFLNSIEILIPYKVSFANESLWQCHYAKVGV